MFWVKRRNNQMVPMPASLEHMLTKLHCNLHLHLNLNKGNNCNNLHIVNVPQQHISEPSSSTTSGPTNKQKPRSGASVLEAMLEKGVALLLGFATFVAFGKFGEPHRRLEACRSMPRRSKFFLGSLLVPD